MPRLACRLFLGSVALLSLGATVARAQLVVDNPDFELPLGSANVWVSNNWSRLGDVKLQGAYGTGPKKGTSQIKITSDPSNNAKVGWYLDGEWDYFNSNGHGWLGFSESGVLWFTGGHGNWGSMIKQKVSANKGDTLKFRYNFLCNDTVVGPTANPDNNSHGLFMIPDWPTSNGYGIQWVIGNVQSNFISATASTGGDFKWMTGWKPKSHVFSKTGNYVIAFGVVDRRTAGWPSNPKVAGLLVDDIQVSTPGVAVSPDSLLVEEGDPALPLDFFLDTKPANNVTVTLNGGTQLTVTPATLTFTPADWDTPQSVNVKAVDDAVVEGNHTGTITITTASSDSAYNALPVPGYIVDITDNDSPGLKVTYPNGKLTVAEAGLADTYKVKLFTIPANPVTVNVTSTDGQLTLFPSVLTFDSTNWNVNQTVTVRAVNDTLFEADHNGEFQHATTSTDTNYNGLLVLGEAAIADNDYPDEGSFSGSGAGGSSSSPEGGFGMGRARRKTLAAAGPIANQPGGHRVINVSHQNPEQPRDAEPHAVASALLTALALGIVSLLVFGLWHFRP